MKSWRTSDNVMIYQVLSGRTNAYLVESNNQLILVDTGTKGSYKKLLGSLNSINQRVEDVSTLILTHTHYDHCQSAQRLKATSSCSIVVSGNAAEAIKTGYSTIPNGTIAITKFLVSIERLIGGKKLGYKPFVADDLVNGNFQFDPGFSNIKLLETPGHSADSVSVIINNEIAIVGDAMFGIFKNSVFPPFADDIPLMIKSWGKLLETGCQLFLPGHGRAISSQLLQKEYLKYQKIYI